MDHIANVVTQMIARPVMDVDGRLMLQLTCPHVGSCKTMILSRFRVLNVTSSCRTCDLVEFIDNHG